MFCINGMFQIGEIDLQFARGLGRILTLAGKKFLLVEKVKGR
jgi:hypothetical protein